MLVQGEPNQRLLLCKSLTFSARIFCGKKNVFVYLFAPNDHEQTAIYKNHSSYIYSVMHSYLLQKLSVFLLGYLGWLAVGRLHAEKKIFSDVGTHLPIVQSTVDIAPITKMYTENLMQLF